jgi:L-asparaginase/beta-aspartyl-peptidase (threonine type)
VQPILVTHCGAGSDASTRDAADRSGAAGLAILNRGGSALDGVLEAIVVLEDDPRLNAGTGSRMRIDGRIQMDAALMDSRMAAGGVAVIEDVKNPIRVAREVMDTPHLLLAGRDAVAFARSKGHPPYDPATPESRRRLEESLVKLRQGRLPAYARNWRRIEVHDTVGAVGRDRRGRFAAGSSTGGTEFMMPGRVGDSPLVGAGLYAGPSGAVTVTGIGEEIIRRVLSKVVYDRIADGLSPQRAADRGLALFRHSVPVGIIAVSRRGWGAASNRDMAFFASSTSRTL